MTYDNESDYDSDEIDVAATFKITLAQARLLFTYWFYCDAGPDFKQQAAQCREALAHIWDKLPEEATQEEMPAEPTD